MELARIERAILEIPINRLFLFSLTILGELNLDGSMCPGGINEIICRICAPYKFIHQRAIQRPIGRADNCS